MDTRIRGLDSNIGADPLIDSDSDSDSELL